MFIYNVKFLTCDEALHLKNGDFNSFKYETKKKSEESVYDNGKRSFCERRGGYWTAVKPRQIRQLEAKFRERTAVFCEWLNDSLIGIVFSSGAIAYLTVKPNTLDVTQILFDRYIVGKISGQTVTGVAFCKSHLLLTHTDRTATLITFGKSLSSGQPCRIRDRDPHVQTVELGGSRRTERKVSSCETSSGARVLVWGAAAVEPAPWSPILEDHANMHLYQIKGQQISLIAYHQLENETLSAEISPKTDNVIHIVEQTVCHKSGVSLSWVRYSLPSVDVRATKLSSAREARACAVLPAPARAVRRSPCDLRLLAACIDGSLHIIHAAVGLTHSTRIGFVATDVRWAGSLALAADDGARLQCLDGALAPLPHPAVCLHLAASLREPRRMQILATRGGRGGPLILASFSGGPLALLRIMHPELMTAWIRCGRADNAVALLRALDWALHGPAALRALSLVVAAALRKELSAGSEARAQAALGAYLAPLAPHAPDASKYASAVHDLARKFFHHLLRRGRVEKALSLCVDLAAWDLCADARWAAQRAGHAALSAEAAALAADVARLHPESTCSGSCSQCSSHSGSDDDSRSSGRGPPPLPRVALPVVPVPRDRPDRPDRPAAGIVPLVPVRDRPDRPDRPAAGIVPLVPVRDRPDRPDRPAAGIVPLVPVRDRPDRPDRPAAGIRPNLHQYLEKTDTIWNTDVDREGDRYAPDRERRSGPDVLDYRRERPSVFDVVPRPQDEQQHYRHLFHTELREEAPSALYRYRERGVVDRPEREPRAAPERNKVKFSDTVTINVVASDSNQCPSPTRELAASLPLCAPHNYLAAFAPLPQHAPAPTGTTRDYVEV